MRTEEAQKFIEVELCGRWPDWKPTPAQVSDWLNWLAPYSWQQASVSVRAHAAESRYKAPIPAAILQHLRAHSKPTPAKQNNAAPNFVTLRAEYVSGCADPTLRPGRLFHSVPCGQDGKPLKPDQHELIDQVCDAWLAQLKSHYPGAIFIIQRY